jgi:predicted NAD/FAD-binding protein
MKIAIIGSGISGLSAAYLMRNSHDVHVFEALEHPGGHAHTETVLEGDRDIQVDTGFIVYNESTYPGFTGLLDELNVLTTASEMSFGVSCSAHNIEYSSRGLSGMLAQPLAMARASRAKMLWEIRRFYRESKCLLDVETNDTASLGEFLDAMKYGDEFRRHFLIPLVGSIWSTPATGVLDYPAQYLFKFLHNHGLLSTSGRLQWRTVQGGARAYVDRLVSHLPNGVRLNSPVRSIDRHETGVTVIPWSGFTQEFDHVVLATHADQSLRLLSEPTATEERALSSFKYKPSRVVLHTDPQVMPRRRQAWAGWNYSAHSCMTDAGPISISYHMNRLQALGAHNDYFISVNPPLDLDDDRIISEFEYAHPQYSVKSLGAQKTLRAINGSNRTHFAGAFFGHGFHEDGFQAGLNVAMELTAPGLLPQWKKVPA